MSARDVILNAVGDTADEISCGLVINVTDAILAALSAAGFVIVPREPTGDARAVLRYLRTQARNGTLHPQVVIQNADKVLGKQDA